MDVLLILVFGLIIGSFLNMCVYRIPREKSILVPRSTCDHCERFLSIKDLIPVLSYLYSKRRCRYCHAIISIRYPCIELLTSFLFLYTYSRFGLSLEFFQGVILVGFLMVIAAIDYDHQLIFDKVLIPMAGIGIILKVMIILPFINVLYYEVLDMIMGFCLGGGLLLLIHWLSKGGIGWGDIKFAAVIGIWLGWKYTLLTLLFAFILGGGVGVFLIVSKLKERKEYIPFGPFLSIAMFMNYFYGMQYMIYYVELFW